MATEPTDTIRLTNEKSKGLSTSKIPDVPKAMPQSSTNTDADYSIIGKVLGGRYEVLRRIGAGGMGIVYLAKHQSLDRNVVVKVLRMDDAAADEEAMARFAREAKGLSKLDHANIVTIHDFGNEGDINYIVMEYIQGETLKARLKRAKRFSMATFGPIAAQILDAVSEAHSQGIIHRDLKPENIMLCIKQGQDNFVKILDFGLAKLTEEDDRDVTKQNEILGTVAFMSPERLRGYEIDARADVYALGVIFYIMLSGRKPFKSGNDITVLFQHIHEPPRPLTDNLPKHHDVPQRVIDLIHMALEKDPKNRPAHAGAMLQMLRDSVDNPSLLNTPWVSLNSSGLISGSLDMSMAQLQSAAAAHHNIMELEVGDMVTSPSTSMGIQEMAPPPRSQSNARGLWIALIALLVLALGLGGYLVSKPKNSDKKEEVTQASATTPTPSTDPEPPATVTVEPPSPVKPEVTPPVAVAVDPTPAPPPEASSEQKTAEALALASSLVEKHNYAQAQSLLNAIKGNISDPVQLVTVAQLETTITTGRLLEECSQLEAQQDFNGALDIYRRILKGSPNHEVATTNVARLEKYPNVSMVSPIDATIWLDDKRLGESPQHRKLSPGKHSLVFKAVGRDSWSAELEFTEGKNETVEAKFKKKKRTGKRRPKATADQTVAQETTPAETTPDPEKKRVKLLVPTDTPKPKSDGVKLLTP